MTDQQRVQDLLGAAGHLATGRALQLQALALGHLAQIRTEERTRAARIARNHEIEESALNGQYEAPYDVRWIPCPGRQEIAAKILAGG